MEQATAAVPISEPRRGETLSLQASTTAAGVAMQPPPPRRPRPSAAADAPIGADPETGAWGGVGGDLLPHPQLQLGLVSEPTDAGPLSPGALVYPQRKRQRLRSAAQQPLGTQQQHEQAAVTAASPYPSAPPSLFMSDASGFSPLGPLSPLDGRLRRSSMMSSATVVSSSCLPPISPLDLGGIEQQQGHPEFVGASPHQQQPGSQQPHQQQQQSTAGEPPTVHPGQSGASAAKRPAPHFAVPPLEVNVDAAAAGPSANPGSASAGPSGGALTPHLGDAITPGRLLLGSPVDLGDSLERAVDVAAELGLLPGGADVCGLLASPEHVNLLTSPRGGGLLASLRDVMLASPLGTNGTAGGALTGASLAALLGGNAAGAFNGSGSTTAAGGTMPSVAGSAAANPLAGALSPLATPLFSGRPRNSWARRESRQRSSLLSASTPQPELSAWVPCSTQSTGANAVAGSGSAAGGGWQEVQPPWVSAAAAAAAAGARPTIELQRATSRGASHRAGGIRGLKQRGAAAGGSGFGSAGFAAQQQQDDARGQHDQFAQRGWQQQERGAPASAGASRPTPRPWNGRSGVPVSILRELPSRRRPPAMLDSLERVWECAGRRLPVPAQVP